MESHPPFLRPTPWQRWLYRFWPSQRLNMDPLADHRVADRYVPVTIANWKLIPQVACLLLARRVEQPLTFEASARLTVLIPFRDRHPHLGQLLPVLRAKLREQAVQHRILVVEQEAGRPFNRGKLINVGLRHAADSCDYYCIHDVDAIPVQANYQCPSQPLRLVNTLASTDRPATECPRHYFSGAISLRREQALAVNGFSNQYWGWGKEDDEFLFRLQLAGYLCYFDSQGTFHDLPNPPHQPSAADRRVPESARFNRARRSRLMRGLVDPDEDGVSTLTAELLDRQETDDYEKICVRI